MPRPFARTLKHHLVRTGLTESDLRAVLHDVPYRTWKRWLDRESEPPGSARGCMEELLEAIPDDSEIKTLEDIWEARRRGEDSS